MKFIFSKNWTAKSSRTKLNPDRAWLVLLGVLFVSLVYFSIQGVRWYYAIEGDQPLLPAGERVLSSKEFRVIFGIYAEKEKTFGRLLDTPPTISDPAH